MFGQFFKKRTQKLANQPVKANPAAEALLEVIAERKKEDPLIGLKIGSKEVTQRLINGLKNERGVHIESLLTALGSLAGFSCQMSLREQLVEDGKVTDPNAVVIVQGADGKKYYFGDLLNRPLAESQYSIWSLAAGAAQHLGCQELPDLDGIFKHVSQTVGGDQFGIPRIPDDHRAGDLPIEYVKVIWPSIFPVVKQFCDKPSEWPILFGLAVQEVISMGKDVIEPKLAVTIVMESAIPMSKIDLAIA